MKDFETMKNDTSLSSEEQNKERSQTSRRIFLKKSVYAAPVLIAMGQLLKPVNAYADASGGPDGPPKTGWNP